MDKTQNLHPPKSLLAIEADTRKIEFKMASEPLVGSLLRTLAASKVKGRFLELGTGTGLSTAWLLDGMNSDSTLVTMDNDQTLLDVAHRHLGSDSRLRIVCEDGDEFVSSLSAKGEKFDFIFADTWAGKYRFIEETLGLLNRHGLYVIDDMLTQQNWPEDHPPKVERLLALLEEREDFLITKIAWSCGVVICTKI